MPVCPIPQPFVLAVHQSLGPTAPSCPESCGTLGESPEQVNKCFAKIDTTRSAQPVPGTPTNTITPVLPSPVSSHPPPAAEKVFSNRSHCRILKIKDLCLLTHVCIHNSRCLHACIMCVRTYVRVHVEVRGQHRGSSSVSYHLVLCDRVSHRTWSSQILLDCLTSKLFFLPLQCQGYRWMPPSPGFFCGVLRD